LNLQNSAATNGLTLTAMNTSAGNVQLGLTGTLSNSGLANSSTTVNGQTCTLGAACTVPNPTVNGQTCALGSTCNVNSGAAAGTLALNNGSGSALTGIDLPDVHRF